MSELDALTAEPGFCGTRLFAPVERIADDLQQLGMTLAVTMNTAAVMTRIGRYGAPQFAGGPLASHEDATCVRLYGPAVETTLAVERTKSNRLPCSVQFFSETGAVLHKSFLTECWDDLAFMRLIHRWEADGKPVTDGRPLSLTAPEPTGDYARQIDSVFGDHGLTRRAALPDWGRKWAWRVPPEMVFDILTLAADVRMPLAQSIGNAGAIQIHRAALETVRRSDALVLVSSGGCTVSFDHAEIEEAWVTRFEAGDRSAYMVELYDWRFHCIAQFIALDLGNPGLERYWEQLLLSLPRIAPDARRAGPVS